MNNNGFTTKDMSIRDFHKMIDDCMPDSEAFHMHMQGDLLIVESATQAEYEQAVTRVNSGIRSIPCKRYKGNAKRQRKLKRKLINKFA